MLTMHRPARLASSETVLDREYRSARWTYHRLLDFEDQHQLVINDVAEAIAPGIGRVGRILAKLARREKRASRTTSGNWAPKSRPALEKRLKEMLAELRAVRNADPRWKEALGWADEPVGAPKKPRRRRAKPAHKVKRRKSETDEQWQKRFVLLTSDETDEHYAKKVAEARRQTRREVYRAALYRKRRIYWGTWNALCDSIDQARADVLKRRKQGLPADWRRPRFGDNLSLAADAGKTTDTGGFRIIERGKLWWTIKMRLGIVTGNNAQWAVVRVKFGNWHDVPDDAKFKTATLTRRQDGQRWSYTLSVTVEGVEKKVALPLAKVSQRMVAFDWGHREYGHDSAADGMRAFVWLGEDGNKGEILLPTECRDMQDEIDAIKTRLDEKYNARKKALSLRNKNRYTYRLALLRLGVHTEEQANWLRWEMRQERRIARRRKRYQDLRCETYIRAIRKLLRRYGTFVFESESNASIKQQQIDEEMRRRARANRDLTARYEFVELCERLGATIASVSARNTTRECPECGHLDENTAELLIACSGCGVVRDKDFGAARVILRRGQGPLASHAAE